MKNFNRRIQGRVRVLINSTAERTRVVRVFFKELCDNSSIHGVVYFTKRGLHWSERLWWIIAFCVSLCLCGSMIYNVWVQWQDNPVQMSFFEKQKPITEIPFPTVTICTGVKTLKDDKQMKEVTPFNISSALNSLSNLSDIETMQLNALAHICSRLPDLVNYEEKFASESIYSTIYRISPPRGVSLYLCLLVGVHYPCEQFYIPVLTEEGICYSFNALNSHEIYTDEIAPEMLIARDNQNLSGWEFESGYKEFSNTVIYPIRVANSGSGTGFDLFLRTFEGDFDYQCNEYQGYKIAFSVPGEALTMSRNSFKLPLERDIQIAIKPKWTITSEGLRNYSPNQRQCFFQAERRLRFFKIYTQLNCEEECLANFTKLECGCVRFSMPRDRNTNICGAGSIKCYRAAKKNLFNSAKSFLNQCNCLPSCTSIEYNYQIDQIKFEQQIIRQIGGRERQKFETLHAKLGVFFQSNQVSPVKRVEMYSFSDFMAICGGLLGLFLGISALSIVELIYYSTLRLFWANRRSKFEIVTVLTVPSHSRVVKKMLESVRIIWVFLKEFFDNSNIHGVRYFSERLLHFSERFCWMVAVSLSIWLCGSMTRDIWVQWRENPVTMSFTEKDLPIRSVPFPTVIVCPETKVTGLKIDWDKDVTMFEKPLPAIKIKRLNTLTHLCPFMRYASSVAFKSEPHIDDSIYDIIEDMAPKLSETFYMCRWQNELSDCSKLFVPSFTDEGYCFTFNALNSHDIYTDEMAPRMMIVNSNPNLSDWNLENAYENANYPIRVTDSGRYASLDIGLLFNERDISDTCKVLLN